jgi:hypothetical protein
MQGVHDARPIEGYDRDAIVAFHVDKFKSHRVPLILDVGPRVLRGPGLWRFPENIIDRDLSGMNDVCHCG